MAEPIVIPRWSAHLTAALAGLATLAGLYAQYFREPEVLTLAAANAALAESVAEYGIHIVETPVWESGDTSLAVRAYADGCVAIVRKTPTRTVSRLVVDLARQGAPPASWTLPGVATVSAQGRCLPAHPGPFSWRYGDRVGEWVEVWRLWPEGCEHVQLFHPPSGAWAVNPDGTPQVRWTQCRH